MSSTLAAHVDAEARPIGENVGAPDAERLHRGSKLAGQAAVYTHKDPANLLAQLRAGRIHRAEEIPVYFFGRGFIDTAAKAIERRNAMIVSVTERQLYLGINGQSFSTAIEEHRLG